MSGFFAYPPKLEGDFVKAGLTRDIVGDAGQAVAFQNGSGTIQVANW
jgi:hypothetical protein